MKDTNRIGAFFDLDRTLIARSSGELYIKVLREQGFLTRKDLAMIFLASILYRLNLLEPENLMKKFSHRFRGDSEQEMISFCKEWFQTTVKDYLYEDAIERVGEHREKGHTLAILTAATPYIAEPTGRFLGIEHALCTRLEVKDDLFTGEMILPICHGEGKLHWARRFCEERGIDLSRSYFYTDSISDLPVLLEVGHPVPVNPDLFLLREAKKRGWSVQTYRRTLNNEPRRN